MQFESAGTPNVSRPISDQPPRSRRMLTSSQACAACPVRQLGVCRLLNVAEITRLKQIALRRQVAAGETIMSEGDAPYYFAIIVSGVVKLIKTLPGGVRQPVGFLFPSDFIGRPLAAASPFSAVAVTDVELCSYRRSQFENLFQVHPEIEHCLYLARSQRARQRPRLDVAASPKNGGGEGCQPATPVRPERWTGEWSN